MSPGHRPPGWVNSDCVAPQLAYLGFSSYQWLAWYQVNLVTSSIKNKGKLAESFPFRNYASYQSNCLRSMCCPRQSLMVYVCRCKKNIWHKSCWPWPWQIVGKFRNSPNRDKNDVILSVLMKHEIVKIIMKPLCIINLIYRIIIEHVFITDSLWCSVLCG